MRCDSPIYTFGFSFQPWLGERKFPEARDIREHIEETMRASDITRHVRYGTRVTRAEIDTVAAGGRLAPAILEEARDSVPFFIGNGVKDIGYYLSMSETAGAQTTVADGVLTALKSIADQGHGQDYMSDLVAHFRK